jgi:hypothetical protein
MHVSDGTHTLHPAARPLIRPARDDTSDDYYTRLAVARAHPASAGPASSGPGEACVPRPPRAACRAPASRRGWRYHSQTGTRIPVGGAGRTGPGRWTHTIGIGSAIAMACDIIIAAEDPYITTRTWPATTGSRSACTTASLSATAVPSSGCCPRAFPWRRIPFHRPPRNGPRARRPACHQLRRAERLASGDCRQNGPAPAGAARLGPGMDQADREQAGHPELRVDDGAETRARDDHDPARPERQGRNRPVERPVPDRSFQNIRPTPASA